MKKTTIFKIFAGLICAGILLTGCNNSVKDNAQNGKTAYINGGNVKVGQAGSELTAGTEYSAVTEQASIQNARTALPEFSVETIEDFEFTLVGTKSGGAETELGTYESLTELQEASIPLETGSYDFTLTATKDGTVLTSTIQKKEIVEGNNELTFTLEWDETALDSTQTGGIKFTFDYSAATNASDVKCVTGELLEYDSMTETETALDDKKYWETALAPEDGVVIYELDTVPAGVYVIKIRLYADEDKKIPLLAPISEIAIITGGQISRSSNSTQALNQIYTITFNGLEDAIVTDVPAKYTCVQETITLPTPQKLGWIFDGWYTKSDCSGTAVTQIEKGSTGNKTFYAKWDVNSYDVTLNNNGGTINNGNVTSYTYGVGATLPTDVTKTGYTFGGWYDNSSCDVLISG